MNNLEQGSAGSSLAHNPPLLPDFQPNAGRRATSRPAQDITAQVGRGEIPHDLPKLSYQTPQPSQQKPTSQRPLDNYYENLGDTAPQAAPGRKKAKAEILGQSEKLTPQPFRASDQENDDLDAIQARHDARQAAIKSRDAEQIERWVMLDSARNLLNTVQHGEKPHRTALCMRLTLPTKATGLQRGQVEIKHATGHDGQGRARYANLIRCGSVWACPVCAQRIAAQRGAEVKAALGQHMAEGGRVMFGTLTHRGGRGKTAESLASQLKKQAKALKTMQETYSYKQLLRNNGVLGMIRALEMTYSHADGGGWHVHIHILILVAGNEQQAQRHKKVLADLDQQAAQRAADQGRAPRQRKAREAVGVPSVADLPQFGLDFVAAWQQAASKAGLYAAPDAQQCVVAADDLPTLERLANYLTKCDWDSKKQDWVSTGQDYTEAFGGQEQHQAAVSMVERAGDTSGASSAALEVVGGVTSKRGRASSLAPMQLLRDYALNGVQHGKKLEGEELAKQRQAHQHGILWREYANSTRGQRALVWGAGLKALYAVPDAPDEDGDQIPADDLAPIEKQLCVLEGGDWHEVLQARRGTRGELLQVAAEGDPAAVFAYVGEIKRRNSVARELKNQNQNTNVAKRPARYTRRE